MSGRLFEHLTFQTHCPAGCGRQHTQSAKPGEREAAAVVQHQQLRLHGKTQPMQGHARQRLLVGCAALDCKLRSPFGLLGPCAGRR